MTHGILVDPMVVATSSLYVYGMMALLWLLANETFCSDYQRIRKHLRWPSSYLRFAIRSLLSLFLHWFYFGSPELLIRSFQPALLLCSASVAFALIRCHRVLPSAALTFWSNARFFRVPLSNVGFLRVPFNRTLPSSTHILIIPVLQRVRLLSSVLSLLLSLYWVCNSIVRSRSLVILCQ